MKDLNVNERLAEITLWLYTDDRARNIEGDNTT